MVRYRQWPHQPTIPPWVWLATSFWSLIRTNISYFRLTNVQRSLGSDCQLSAPLQHRPLNGLLNPPRSRNPRHRYTAASLIPYQHSKIMVAPYLPILSSLPFLVLLTCHASYAASSKLTSYILSNEFDNSSRRKRSWSHSCHGCEDDEFYLSQLMQESNLQQNHDCFAQVCIESEWLHALIRYREVLTLFRRALNVFLLYRGILLLDNQTQREV